MGRFGNGPLMIRSMRATFESSRDPVRLLLGLVLWALPQWGSAAVVSESQRIAYDDITTIVGATRMPGTTDGPDSDARLFGPAAIAMRNQSLLIAEHGNHAIREISPPTTTSNLWRGFQVFFSTCADVRAEDPSAGDGIYTLYLKGNQSQPFRVFCVDMSTNPREYLMVRNTTNYASYTCGALLMGT